jgi:hypothetical protein
MPIYQYIHNPTKVFVKSKHESDWFECVKPKKTFKFVKFNSKEPFHNDFNKWLDKYQSMNIPNDGSDYGELYVGPKFFNRKDWRVAHSNSSCTIL